MQERGFRVVSNYGRHDAGETILIFISILSAGVNLIQVGLIIDNHLVIIV